MKPINFRGRALADLRAFPEGPRRAAGYQLDRVQNGLDPDDWKPMQSVGDGVRDIRIRDSQGAFRVLYVAKLGEGICVLHCFQKKSERTAKRDLDLARTRLRELVEELKQ
jgi:phage-related protein